MNRGTRKGLVALSSQAERLNQLCEWGTSLWLADDGWLRKQVPDDSQSLSRGQLVPVMKGREGREPPGTSFVRCCNMERFHYT